MNIEGLDYNTQRAKLILPEYGREIQQMVDHCLTLTDREERQRCAELLEDLLKLPETFLLVIKLSVHKQQVLKVHTSTKLLQTTRLPIRYIPSKLQMPTMTKSKKF